MLNIDKTKIKRVWNNLVNNAVKYSKENSRVVISIVQELDKVRFEVADEGIGIKEDDLEKIYNIFYCTYFILYDKFNWKRKS